MIAILVNACVKADDDLYNEWNTNSGNVQTDITFNRIDHLVEFVVEVCFGMDNFFPEHHSDTTNHNDLHKLFKLYITPCTFPVLVAQTIILPIKQKGTFPDFVQSAGCNYQDFISPPPKA
jgi:hypothetical protein